ncbi:PPOX class F420-dependent oxidoreductase [Streptomyces sp. TRM66268-LWL]|uniref:PPOX class F420-dependent oxidoreductase n=1 Tax=Streptomyces polyasparticus TaxID=2767826 RepID=A0ABR7SJ74_9ACTN|nr:PPOX class F420-dependent oxidoreductase [Streptomyces polyasparticus]MBC9715545.1 PPOX class F420-dependent oxidoreductase [Streptomyces polyasparticus]
MSITLGAAARRLLEDPHPAILATLNADGSPQTSPVYVGLDGDVLVIPSQAGRRKHRNLLRDPRVSITVYDTAHPQNYVEVRGTATVTEDTGRRLAAALDEQYDGPGAGDSVLALPPEVQRIVIRITPEHVAGRDAH